MNERISNIFDYDDEIVVVKAQGDLIDPARIKELTMNKIHSEQKHTKKRPVGRTLLIAAVVAVILALGSYAVYYYSVRDAAIENVPTFDSKFYDFKADETETRLSINGFSDSPEYQAYVEWTDWNRAWQSEHPDPWTEIGMDDSFHETPVNYLLYEAYFTEQGEKLDEIAAKYGLTLLSELHFLRTETQLCRALDAESLIADGYEIYDGYFFDNGSFSASGRTAVNGNSVYFNIWNAVKGSFVPYSGLIPEDYTEWSYTTKDGVEVILMTDTLRAETTVIAPLDGCYVTGSIKTDDAQAAQDFADAIELPALNALFKTESARAASAQSIADYLEALPFVTTVDEIGEDEQAVLDYLGDWYLTGLPEDTLLYLMDIGTPNHWADFYCVRRSYDGGGHTGSLYYRELDPLDGENDETRLQLSTYSSYYANPTEDDPELSVTMQFRNTPCTVNGCEAMLSEWNGGTDYDLCWLDTDRQLLFTLTMTGFNADELMALAESVSGTAPEKAPQRNASTPEERFQNSLQPLSRVSFTYAEESVLTKRALSELGNYGLSELPDDADIPRLMGFRSYMYEHYWDGRADWISLQKCYSSDPESGVDGLTLTYKRFDDGRTAEAYEIDRQYEGSYSEVTDVSVGGHSGYITGGDIYTLQTILTWYDEGRDLIFVLSISTLKFGDLTEADIVALAEGVTEQPWDGTESIIYELPDTERILSELGRYDLPGGKYGSIVETREDRIEAWNRAPYWFVTDDPYVCESAAATYADGLTLLWERTWADTARKAENGAESFAAMTKYLLTCDDSGAVQTGLSVNGHDAVFVSFPYEEFWGEAHTELIWYDADAGLIFNLAEYPDEGDTARTAAQLITLAESVCTA